MPAKAGIYILLQEKMDSRLRGNDGKRGLLKNRNKTKRPRFYQKRGLLVDGKD